MPYPSAVPGINHDVSCEDVDSATAFQAVDSDITGRARTAHTFYMSQTAMGVGVPNYTPNFADAVQDVVDRPGWMNGNSLNVLIISRQNAAGSQWGDFRAFDGGVPADTATLLLYYTPGQTYLGLTYGYHILNGHLSYQQQAVENPESLYASYFGMHARILDLGRRKEWIKRLGR